LLEQLRNARLDRWRHVSSILKAREEQLNLYREIRIAKLDMKAAFRLPSSPPEKAFLFPRPSITNTTNTYKAFDWGFCLT
jgi:hypothetical protein